ncbi:MAG: alanine racemase [Candidatus Falkowbacteria bacterium]
MINFFRQILKPKYDTLNKIEIDAKKIISNFNYLKERQGSSEIFPVLKSNAYGHGLKEMCLILNKTTAPIVIVDSFPEAQIALRYFKRKILILGEMPLKAYGYCDFKRTEFIIYNSETLRYLARYGKKVQVHLFINSGMNREGVKDLPRFIEDNKKHLDSVEVVGLCSHLASADEESILNQTQEAEFMAALDALRSFGYFPRWVHLGNSAGLLSLNNKLLTAYRPGLALYGYDPFSNADESSAVFNEYLQPAINVTSQIVSVQRLLPNETVSYNETYRASRETNIAVIPFGYFEGLDRRLSNRAEFLVQMSGESVWAPIAGKVCMNLTCLDLGDASAQKGNTVVIVSSNKEDRNSVLALSRYMNTIPYEFLVRLQSNIRREIIW